MMHVLLSISLGFYLLAHAYSFSLYYSHALSVGSVLHRKRASIYDNVKTNMKADNDELGDDDQYISPLKPGTAERVESVLYHELGLILSSAAVNTASYYMLEFQDTVSQQWMINHQDYKDNGFRDGNWENFLKVSV